MTDFLTDEWFALALETTAALPNTPGASAVVQHVISGAPAGKLTLVAELVDGRLVALRTGKRSDVTCTCTWSATDARSVLDASTELEVAFMQGRIKVEGDYVPWLSGLRAWRHAPETRAAFAALAAQTT
jgi:hypothetical protein